jgi:hypothetical protein
MAMDHRAEIAIEGDGEMPIDDGDDIEVAARAKGVEQLTGRSRVPERQAFHRGIDRIVDEGRLGSSDRCLSAMKPMICDL